MIHLRPYQESCIAGLRAAFSKGYRTPLLVSPTGSGKTVMFSHLTSKIAASGKRVTIMVHRDELVDQVSETLNRFDVPHGLITAGFNNHRSRRERVNVASVFTLSKRIDKVDRPDYLICDEAHHAAGKTTWGKIIAQWGTRTMGVTATPLRLSGEGLDDTFDTMVLGPTVRELIDQGALAEYRLFAPPMQADLSGLHARGGDFAKNEVAAAMDTSTVVGDAVKHYRKLCDGMPGVAFCASVEHAQHTAEQFRSAGYRAMSIDGKMDKAVRKQVTRDFALGHINVLTSCDLISEGYDMPGIVAAILLRPTKSLGLYLQQVGRSLRPGKPCAFIIDHAGNAMRHGLPDDDRAWSLVGAKAKGEDVEKSPPARTCGRCYAVSPAYMKACRDCGEVFEIKSRVIGQVEGDLEEVDLTKARKVVDRERGMAKTLEDLMKVGEARGYKAGWAKHILEGRQRRRA